MILDPERSGWRLISMIKYKNHVTWSIVACVYKPNQNKNKRGAYSSWTRQPSTKYDCPMWREDSCSKKEPSCATCRIFELSLSDPWARRPLETLGVNWTDHDSSLGQLASQPLHREQLERAQVRTCSPGWNGSTGTKKGRWCCSELSARRGRLNRDQKREQRKDRQLPDRLMMTEETSDAKRQDVHVFASAEAFG